MHNVSRAARLCLALIISIISARIVSAQQSTPQPISYGQTVNGQLTTGQVEQLYIFAANQGDSITVTMDKIDGNIDPLVILVDQSQQTVLAVDNDSGGDRNARLRFVIPVQGSYVIRATAVQGSGEIKGSYKLTLTLGNAQTSPSGTANAPFITPLPSDQPVSGEINDAARFHIYTLRARKDEPIAASIDVPEGPNKLQVGIYLYTPDFREVARAELGQALNIKAPADGVYLLMVARAAASGAGTFTLRPNAAASASTPNLAPGQTVRGTITADSAVKTYSLQGGAKQAISVRMRRISGNLAVYVYVVAIDTGKMLAQATDTNGVADLSTVLPDAGTYAIVATRAGQQAGTTTGEYALSLRLPDQVTPLPPAFQNYATLEYGDRPSGTIDDTTFVVPFVFNAQTGDIVQATMTTVAGSGDLDPYLLLQSPNGDTLAEDDNSGGGTNARIKAVITKSGPYALIATRANLAKGTTHGKFDLTFNTVSPDLPAANYGTPLVPGQAQAGTNGVGSLYRFDAQANTAVGIDITATGGLEAVAILADSNFQQVNASSGSIRDTLVTKSGTYYLLVVRASGPNAPATGDYTATLKGTVNPVPTTPPGLLVYGKAVTGKITNEVYQVRYTVQAKAGTLLTVTMDAAPGSTLDPMVGVLDSNNNLLGVNDDAAKGLKNAQLTVSIPKDGIYTIAATRSQEAQGTTSGDYILKVDAKQEGPDILPIRYGGTVTGAIDSQRYLYYYNFRGNANDVVTIHMSHIPGHSLDPVLYLYDYTTGQAQLIASNNDQSPGDVDAAIVKFTLPHTGAYLIVATRLGAAQGQTEGSFIVTLTKDN